MEYLRELLFGPDGAYLAFVLDGLASVLAWPGVLLLKMFSGTASDETYIVRIRDYGLPLGIVVWLVALVVARQWWLARHRPREAQARMEGIAEAARKVPAFLRAVRRRLSRAASRPGEASIARPRRDADASGGVGGPGSRPLRTLHLTLWFALLALLLGLLGYTLFFGFAFIVLSPLLLLGAIIGGAIGHGFPDPSRYAEPVLYYLTLCLILSLSTVVVLFRIWILLGPPPRPQAGTRGGWRRWVANLGAASIASPYLPREWIAGAAVAGLALGVAAWIPLADRVVGTVAPVEWVHPKPDPTLVAQPTTEAAKRELEEVIRPGAMRGDAYAQWLLGESLRNGLMGLTPDAAGAGTWIAKSATGSDPDGKLSLITGAVVWDLPDARDNALPPREGQLPRLEAYVAASTGWRRIAAELMFASATNDRLLWLERAARHGSRYAAFVLARELQGRGDVPGGNKADLDEAYAWFEFAGADLRKASLAAKLDAASLARAQARASALMEEMAAVALAPEIARPPADEIARLQRRAQMVGVRARATGSHDMRTHDASAHAIAYAEASGDFADLATYYGETYGTGSSPRDGDLAAWLSALKAKRSRAQR